MVSKIKKRQGGYAVLFGMRCSAETDRSRSNRCRMNRKKKSELETANLTPIEKGDTLALLIAALTVMLPIVLFAFGIVALLIVVLF